MQLNELVGQQLVIGIPGTKITPEIVQHFKTLHAGGLILYRINFESPYQLKKLISDLENALGRKLLVMADHEGGRVIMFRNGITVFPDNLALGTTGKIEYARKQGEIEAKELRRLGIDVNLCPVLDVLTDAYSPNIGIRSYGKDWKLVAAMGPARITAMQKNGISACAKHFPGKGHAPVDAHLGLPVIPSTWKEMEASHLRPFVKAIECGIDVVMSSHPFYPNLDPQPKNIATFSRKIIYDCLRKRLGFNGVISSDDLEMGAIKAICPIGEAGVKAVQAGHDLLLVCHDPDAQKKVYSALLDAYKSKMLPLSALEESAQRIERLKAKRSKRFEGGEPRWEKQGTALVEKICRESVTVVRNNETTFHLKNKKLLVVFPQFSFFDNKIMIEKEVLNEKKFVAGEFAKFKLKPQIEIVSIEPTDEEITKVREKTKNTDFVIYFCFDAHLYPSNKKLLDVLQNSGKQLIVVLLRDPYDAEYLQKNVIGITDFGWRACQIKACIEKLFS